jgi:chemotaxis protein MotB
MKSIVYNNLILSAVSLFLLFSCVSQKKYKTTKELYGNLLELYSNIGAELAENKAVIEQLKREKQYLQLTALKADSLSAEIKYLNKKLTETENLQNKFRADSQEEISAILNQIQKDKEDLQKKEDELTERNKKMIDMQAALDKKDKMSEELRVKLADALLGFDGKGLTIYQKDGKVYVSMDEKLLFKSGKYDIEPSGISALERLAKILEQNVDINIMVEGHTDSIKYGGSAALTDNWDLSVKRATTVVRTILQHSIIDPKRIIAAGCGEHAPISTNSTPEGRQQNRRIEIILTPKIDELLKAIETN